MSIQEENILHFGLLGEKLGHSLSPEIHADLLKQQNIAAAYEIYEMDKQEVLHIFDMMKKENILGMNVTIPYKEVIYNLVDVLDSHAEKIGAVNTILLKDGTFYGYNTDYIGVMSMFHKAGISLDGQRIVILGSGGAAKALIYGFHMGGASSITVAARNEKATMHLKELFPYIHTCSLTDIPEGDIIINTTPVGMYPNMGVSPVDAAVIRKFKVASDIVYNPLVTEFLRIAGEEGLQIVTGLMMLVDQAIGSEEIWLDKKLDYNMGNQIHDELAAKFQK
ncbi:MAG: shikimate dehydrogenase [Muricomes sp.]